MKDKIEYELATKEQIEFLHRHYYYDTEKLSKETAEDLINIYKANNGKCRSKWEEYID